MPRYIDADALKNKILYDMAQAERDGKELQGYTDALFHLKTTPDANVVELPCKVGDTVWFETWKNNATECIGIRPHTVDRIDVIAVCDIEGITPTKLHDWEFGKNVFLTQEEAEKAVKIMEGE